MVVTTGGLKSCRNQVPLRRSRAAAGPARGQREATACHRLQYIFLFGAKSLHQQERKRKKNPEAIMSRCRTPLTATVLKQLKRIIALRDTEELPEEVLRALGCRLERSVEALEINVATLRRWCICIIGPGAQKHWQQQPAEGAAPDVADHTCGRCYLCMPHTEAARMCMWDFASKVCYRTCWLKLTSLPS